MSQAAKTHLAGHKRPAGLVFETPALKGTKQFWSTHIYIHFKNRQNIYSIGRYKTQTSF